MTSEDHHEVAVDLIAMKIAAGEEPADMVDVTTTRTADLVTKIVTDATTDDATTTALVASTVMPLVVVTIATTVVMTTVVETSIMDVKEGVTTTATRRHVRIEEILTLAAEIMNTALRKGILADRLVLLICAGGKRAPTAKTVLITKGDPG